MVQFLLFVVAALVCNVIGAEIKHRASYCVASKLRCPPDVAWNVSPVSGARREWVISVFKRCGEERAVIELLYGRYSSSDDRFSLLEVYQPYDRGLLFLAEFDAISGRSSCRGRLAIHLYTDSCEVKVYRPCYNITE